MSPIKPGSSPYTEYARVHDNKKGNIPDTIIGIVGLTLVFGGAFVIPILINRGLIF